MEPAKTEPDASEVGLCQLVTKGTSAGVSERGLAERSRCETYFMQPASNLLAMASLLVFLDSSQVPPFRSCTLRRNLCHLKIDHLT